MINNRGDGGVYFRASKWRYYVLNIVQSFVRILMKLLPWGINILRPKPDSVLNPEWLVLVFVRQDTMGIDCRKTLALTLLFALFSLSLSCNSLLLCSLSVLTPSVSSLNFLFGSASRYLFAPLGLIAH